jgi:hypothetical protein
MKLSEASKLWLEYHRAHSKENSIRAYEALLGRIYEEFGDANLEEFGGHLIKLLTTLSQSCLISKWRE